MFLGVEAASPVPDLQTGMRTLRARTQIELHHRLRLTQARSGDGEGDAEGKALAARRQSAVGLGEAAHVAMFGRRYARYQETRFKVLRVPW